MERCTLTASIGVQNAESVFHRISQEHEVYKGSFFFLFSLYLMNFVK